MNDTLTHNAVLPRSYLIALHRTAAGPTLDIFQFQGNDSLRPFLIGKSICSAARGAINLITPVLFKTQWPRKGEPPKSIQTTQLSLPCSRCKNDTHLIVTLSYPFVRRTICLCPCRNSLCNHVLKQVITTSNCTKGHQ